jgi:hypothetical protein
MTDNVPSSFSFGPLLAESIDDLQYIFGRAKIHIATKEEFAHAENTLKDLSDIVPKLYEDYVDTVDCVGKMVDDTAKIFAGVKEETIQIEKTTILGIETHKRLQKKHQGLERRYKILLHCAAHSKDMGEIIQSLDERTDDPTHLASLRKAMQEETVLISSLRKGIKKAEAASKKADLPPAK